MPSSLSPWRSNEFNFLSKKFNVAIYSDLSGYIKYDLGNSFNKNLNILSKEYFYLSQKIFKIRKINFINSKLLYFIFISNTLKYFKIAESLNIDFVFTLYPGGGFNLGDNKFNKKLKSVFSSRNFKGVVVNQYHIKSYLIDNKLCCENKIKLIPGVPLNLESNNNSECYKFKKDLKILFFANKYTPSGTDKGFDIFLKVAKILISQIPEISFHIVGGFDKNDINDVEIQTYFKFYGKIKKNDYIKILKKTHIILSPNKPFVLTPYAFDGFPLSTCVEAGLYNNLILATDYFSESKKLDFINNINFIKIRNNEFEISKIILKLNNDRNKLKNIANSGKQKIIDIYSFDNQIKPRIEFFQNLLNQNDKRY